ncbi:hypothetical protein SY88_15295 [Clostridiales bacterium PH28_bin88]|nr:hypothetical protein SY88_15295 [Clostridiales bacterium PH28_bin88]
MQQSNPDNSLTWLKTIINSIYNGIVAINTKGQIILCNQSAAKLVDLPVEEIVGRPIKEVIPGSGLMHVVSMGVPMVSQRLKINDTFVYSNRTPVWENGRIIGAVGVFQEETSVEAISTELAIFKQLTREHDLLIESSYDGIFITDGKGYVAKVNTAYEKVTGIKREEVLGKHMSQMVADGLISHSATLQVLEKREPVTIVQQTRGGIEIMVTSTPIFNDQGEITMVLSNVRDMSRLKHLEAELDKTRSLTERYQQQLKELQLQQLQSSEIILQSPAMIKTYEAAVRVAPFDSTVLIQGESGVGKEVVARLIHKESGRTEKPFIKVNCGAIPENLLETELFGYERGAFTGSNRDGKAGLFEVADGGILFLDEVGELPLNLQVKLLRVLQDKEIKRVGGNRFRTVDVRLVAATNRDLQEMVESGRFREDLFYRLNVIPLYIPPLRERPEDVVALIQHFVKKLNKKYGMNKSLSPAAFKRLYEYHWPGNVRELGNVMENIMIMSESTTIGVEHLPKHFMKDRDSNQEAVVVKDIIRLGEAREQLEQKLIEMALRKTGSLRKAASLLGMDHSTLSRKRNRR